MTIKVTNEMIEAGEKAVPFPKVFAEEVQRIVAAALALLDPVPDHVQTIVDRDGDGWNRNPNDPLVWCHEDGMYFRTLSTIIPEHGPITWDGKK